MVGAVGIVPAGRPAESVARLLTCASNQSERSEEWWARMDLNHRPPACEAGALPLSHAPRRGNTSEISV